MGDTQGIPWGDTWADTLLQARRGIPIEKLQGTGPLAVLTPRLIMASRCAWLVSGCSAVVVSVVRVNGSAASVSGAMDPPGGPPAPPVDYPWLQGRIPQGGHGKPQETPPGGCETGGTTNSWGSPQRDPMTTDPRSARATLVMKTESPYLGPPSPYPRGT
jgi:hypothetical protein